MPKYLDETGLAHFWDNIQDKLMPSVTVKSPVANGSVVLVSYDSHNVLFDCASANGGASLATWLTAQGVTTLDAVVLTHMHNDHVGGFSSVVPFCDSDTDIFVQMAPTSSNPEYSTYTDLLFTVTNLCSTNNLKSPRTPSDGESVDYGIGTLTLFNTDTSNRSTYDTAIANAGYDANQTGGLNNYSLMSVLKVSDFTYVDTGDAEGEAQRLNVQNMPKATVARNPHHFANMMGYFEWYNRLSPEYWIVTLTAYEDTQSVPITYVSYIYRYVTYGYASNVLYPYTQDIDITWHGSITAISGDRMDIRGSEYDKQQGNFYVALPPDYYNVDPYILHSMDIKEFMLATRNGKQQTLAMYTSSTFITTSTLWSRFTTLLQTSSDTILVDVGYQELQVSIVDLYKRLRNAVFYSSYVDSDFGTFTHYKVYTEAMPAVQVEFSPALTTGDSLYVGDNSALVDHVLRANIVTARLSTGALIPCVRVGSSGETGRGTFRGMMFSGGFDLLYSVQFNNSGNLTQAKSYKLSDGTVADISVNRLSVIV